MIYKTFFVFHTDKNKVWIYAESDEVAKQKLHNRMSKDYGQGGWKITSQVVRKYADPIDAAANSPGSLLNALCRADALEFLEDHRRNEIGRPPKPKYAPQSSLARDIETYEGRLKMEALRRA